jgi:hypothetical protein
MGRCPEQCQSKYDTFGISRGLEKHAHWNYEYTTHDTSYYCHGKVRRACMTSCMQKRNAVLYDMKGIDQCSNLCSQSFICKGGVLFNYLHVYNYTNAFTVHLSRIMYHVSCITSFLTMHATRTKQHTT